MPSNWPTAKDALRLYQSMGLVSIPPSAIQSMFDFTGAVASAIDAFAKATRFEPFRVAVDGSGNPVDSTIKFGPDDILYPPEDYPMLDLDGGFVSITSLKVGVTGTNAGTALVQDTDYFLKPSNAVSKGKPYTWIEFYRSPLYTSVAPGGGQPNSIQATGKRGYSLNVPDGAFQAVVRKAGIDMAPQVALALRGGLVKWTEADVSEQYSEKLLDSAVEIWAGQWNNAVSPAQFGRIVVK